MLSKFYLYHLWRDIGVKTCTEMGKIIHWLLLKVGRDADRFQTEQCAGLFCQGVSQAGRAGLPVSTLAPWPGC